MHNIKAALYQLCLDFVQQKIQTAETALEQSREASNDDTKSSAGDKFETTREMMQQDINRNKMLLMDANQNLRMLQSLSDLEPSDTIKNGSLIDTDQGFFYISISAGQLKTADKTVYAVSAMSPIGKEMIGKKAGNTVSFNQKKYNIKNVL